MQRTLEPELLDSLPHDDPAAVRSRRDLRLINAVMGNLRWAVRTLDREAPGGSVVELGAGDGGLCARLHASGHPTTGCDLIPRPDSLDSAIAWCGGDIRETLPRERADAAVSVHFLHHFDEATLNELGSTLQRNFRTLVICEPFRSRGTLAGGVLLFPLVNHVTRHDMTISIRAGFQEGELPALLGLDNAAWRIHESATARGALHLVARRIDS